jgi:hypothetical protein
MQEVLHFTFHIAAADLPRMNNDKIAKKSASLLSTKRPAQREKLFAKVPIDRRRLVAWLAKACRERGFIKWLADYVKRSPRQLANLAKARRIPRAANGYNFDWGANIDDLAMLIGELRKFRKGKRKSPPKRRKRITVLDQFGRAVHYAAWLAQINKIELLQDEIRSAKLTRLRSLANSLMALSQVRAAIERRLDQVAGVRS